MCSTSTPSFCRLSYLPWSLELAVQELDLFILQVLVLILLLARFSYLPWSLVLAVQNLTPPTLTYMYIATTWSELKIVDLFDPFDKQVVCDTELWTL